jgi:hypothetical protein
MGRSRCCRGDALSGGECLSPGTTEAPVPAGRSSRTALLCARPSCAFRASLRPLCIWSGFPEFSIPQSLASFSGEEVCEHRAKYGIRRFPVSAHSCFAGRAVPIAGPWAQLDEERKAIARRDKVRPEPRGATVAIGERMNAHLLGVDPRTQRDDVCDLSRRG